MYAVRPPPALPRRTRHRSWGGLRDTTREDAEASTDVSCRYIARSDEAEGAAGARVRHPRPSPAVTHARLRAAQAARAAARRAAQHLVRLPLPRSAPDASIGVGHHRRAREAQSAARRRPGADRAARQGGLHDHRRGQGALHELVSQTGPEAYDDEGLFGIRLAFFRDTDADVRLRILEGRRRTVERQREGLRSSIARTRERLDRYTLELQRHGLESVDREVRWLSELIDSERRGTGPSSGQQ